MSTSQKIVLGAGLILAAIVLLLIILVTGSGKSAQLSPNPTKPLGSKGNGITISPTEFVILEPEKKQSFSITFTKPIELSSFTIEVTSAPFGDSPTATPFSVTKNNPQTISITPNEPLTAKTAYTLVLKEKNTGNILLSANYSSGDEPDPTISTNNQVLKNFLPYETPTYRLSYVASRNVYVFNFKIDPSSKESLEIQYEKAKEAATLFMTSKGFKMNEITIEWRHS